jgi:hypothetical protein
MCLHAISIFVTSTIVSDVIYTDMSCFTLGPGSSLAGSGTCISMSIAARPSGRKVLICPISASPVRPRSGVAIYRHVMFHAWSGSSLTGTCISMLIAARPSGRVWPPHVPNVRREPCPSTILLAQLPMKTIQALLFQNVQCFPSERHAR